MKLIVVESPTKAKALTSYLKNDTDNYKVLASFGHVRSLSRTTGSVDVDKDYAMSWDTIPKSLKAVKEIISNAKASDEVILATDPDREGEAISWHLVELLNKSKVKAKLSRMTFHSITPSSIKEALNNLKEIDQKLVDAYMARLGLDYLVGYNLSPVLWRKLPGSKSAGRVQSAALRIITDREYEIQSFIPEEYWTLHAKFTQNNYSCDAELIKWDDKKVERFMWNKDSVKSAVDSLFQDNYQVNEFEHKEQLRRPYAPLITSTLQQEAANRLGWKPVFTMRVAQKLYEGIKIDKKIVGLITYMRTDSVNISAQGIEECRKAIKEQFGDKYLPEKANFYKSKVRNAQEAHEAIRPTNFTYYPKEIQQYLDEDCFKLYDLIWKRAVSSQMMPAIYESCNMFIQGSKGLWKAHGVKGKFDGFQKLYNVEKLENVDIWMFEKGDVNCESVESETHETKPLPRFTETSLIKYLEDKGIGRPSTYANILNVLDAREYVFRDKKAIVPSNLGWLVSAFLKNNFELYVQDGFTSEMENQLDLVAQGEKDWKELLANFWKDFKLQIDSAFQLDMRDVLKEISKTYAQHFFKQGEAPKCSKCDGVQELRISKGNGFLCCSNYPECDWSKSVDNALDKNVTVGVDPDSGDEIMLKHGPYGYYLQWGATEVKSRVILPKMFAPPHTVTLEEALKIKQLPIVIGNHPENGEEIKVGIGRFGPWILYKKTYVSLKKSPFDVTLEECLDILNVPRNKSKIESKNKEEKDPKTTEVKKKTRRKNSK